MSNPWAKSFEDLRAPYLQEKKAKKDYDGDGKIESGTDEYMGSKDKAIKKAMAMKGKKKVAEHHQKDADGNTIPHEDEGDGTPSSVEEGKKYGPNNPTGKIGKDLIDKALNKLKNNTPAKKVDKAHYEPEGDVVSEEDKKGKGSGKKDACYKKVKAASDVWPSAYGSGRLVQCRKVGAANYGNSKKEEFDFRIKSFDDMVGECWKTHKQVGTKMKGGKVVPNCVPKNEEFVGEEGINKDPAFDIMRPGGANSPFNADGTPKRKSLNKVRGTAFKKEEIKITPHDISGGTKAGKDFMSGRKNPKTGKPVYKLSNPGGMKINLAHYDWKSDLDFVDEALKGKKLDINDSGKVKNKIQINPDIKTEEAKAPVKK